MAANRGLGTGRRAGAATAGDASRTGRGRVVLVLRLVVCGDCRGARGGADRRPEVNRGLALARAPSRTVLARQVGVVSGRVGRAVRLVVQQRVRGCVGVLLVVRTVAGPALCRRACAVPDDAGAVEVGLGAAHVRVRRCRGCRAQSLGRDVQRGRAARRHRRCARRRRGRRRGLLLARRRAGGRSRRAWRGHLLLLLLLLRHLLLLLLLCGGLLLLQSLLLVERR